MAASILVPNQVVASYREHMDSVRVPFYLVWGVTALLTQLSVYGLAGTVDVGQFVVTMTLAGFFFAGAVFRDRRFDVLLVIAAVGAIGAFLSGMWDAVLFSPITIG